MASIAFIDVELSHFCTTSFNKLKFPIDESCIARKDDIPDTAIDQNLNEYEKYFTPEAWNLINDISKPICMIILENINMHCICINSY